MHTCRRASSRSLINLLHKTSWQNIFLQLMLCNSYESGKEEESVFTFIADVKLL